MAIRTHWATVLVLPHVASSQVNALHTFGSRLGLPFRCFATNQILPQRSEEKVARRVSEEEAGTRVAGATVEK